MYNRAVLLVGKKKLLQFMERYPDARNAIAAWIAEVESCSWASMSDLKRRYPHASVISATRVVFNIRGNNYRLDAKINMSSQAVLVIRIGTHSDYDRWNLREA